MPSKTMKDVDLSAQNEMGRLLKGIIDRMQAENGKRFIKLCNLDCKFGCLLDTGGLLDGSDETNIKERCIAIESFYDTDLRA